MLMAWNDAGREQYVLPENVPANEFLNLKVRNSRKAGDGASIWRNF